MGWYTRANAEVCLIAKHGKPQVLDHSVKQILESKDRSILMGKKARKRVIEQFSWDVVTDRTLKIYKEFVK